MYDVKTMLNNLIFPAKCKCCSKIADGDNLCAECMLKLEEERIPAEKRCIDKKFELVDKVYASYYYNGRAEDAVIYAKFHNPASFLNSLLEDISIDISRVLEENNIDMVMGVPSHKSKLYTQEYDLPREMAKRVSCAFAVPLCSSVVKTRKTARQHDLPLDKRKVNLINAYTVNGDKLCISCGEKCCCSYAEGREGNRSDKVEADHKTHNHGGDNEITLSQSGKCIT